MLRLLFTMLFFLLVTVLVAQIDTTNNTILRNKVSKRVIKHISRNPFRQEDATIKSEEIFKPYDGKIIRDIFIDQVGFERSLYDTARTFRGRITRLANSLHSDTREKTIRENLFIRSGRPLNPYKLADNERYLRDLDFILDSKIEVQEVPGTDSVDVIITTRDVFSLGIRGKVSSIDDYEVGLYDANILGMGQRLQLDMGLETDRTPFAAIDWFYRKTSVMGSLINASLGYTQLDNGRSVGEEYEHAYFIRLDRPLVSPYSRLAGGLELSRNWSRNVYGSTDSLFRNYRYDVEDVWAGYNIGVANRSINRNRYFTAIRYYKQHYSRQPWQEVDRVRSLYNDQRFLLGSFTFYNQNFYKTRYVYGFGRTEDIPYGTTITGTSGWAEELGQKRIYTGVSATKSFVHKSGDFFEGKVGAGTFLNDNKTEDTFVFINGTYFSKLWTPGSFKFRHLINMGYARAFNNTILPLVTLNNELRGFTADSVFALQRIVLRAESTMFTNLKWIGFRLAPFLSLESAHLTSRDDVTLPRKFIFGTTGGIRIRNENLIFGTIELRAIYFPTDVAGVKQLGFKVTTNVRLKYSGSFVSPPSFIQYN